MSEDSHRFASIVQPALVDVNLLFANDFEAEKLTGISLRENGIIREKAVRQAAQALLRMGVQSWVVIHFPEAVFACSPSGENHWQASLGIQSSVIKGAAGAGDALAAGILMGVHEEWTMAKSLQLGVCAAAASLFHASCSLGVLRAEECLALSQTYGYKILPQNNRE